MNDKAIVGDINGSNLKSDPVDDQVWVMTVEEIERKITGGKPADA